MPLPDGVDFPDFGLADVSADSDRRATDERSANDRRAVGGANWWGVEYNRGNPKAVKFALVDRIVECVPGERIVAVKAVSLAEEYLADHFPSFPVLPGVLMLESLCEAAAWLVRASEDFAHSVILLSEAKNVTYKSFVKPGHLLRTEVTCRHLAPDGSTFQGVGHCDGKEVIKARFALRHLNLAGESEAMAPVDSRIKEEARERFALLCESA